MGLGRSNGLEGAQDMLLSLSSLNKPFLIKLNLSFFFSGLRAPLAFGGRFVYTSLSQSRQTPIGALVKAPACFSRIILEKGIFPRVTVESGDITGKVLTKCAPSVTNTNEKGHLITGDSSYKKF